MKRILLFTTLLLLVSSYVNAQTGTPSSKLTWDQQSSDLATAQAFTYKYYPDSSVTGTTLVGVICTGTTAPFVCQSPFPAFTPGAHTLTLTASNLAGESAKSLVISFTFVVIPSAPSNIRIQ